MALVVRTLVLNVHPSSECRFLDRIEVQVCRAQSFLFAFRWRILGDIARVRLPRGATPARCHGLWKHTCFEIFLRCHDGSYYEFNLAPSLHWAAYRFAAYRQGMSELDLPTAPRIGVAAAGDTFTLDASIDLRGLLDRDAGLWPRMALPAVIEERGGRLYYWALAHPPGKADFHHADGFVGRLPDNVG